MNNSFKDVSSFKSEQEYKKSKKKPKSKFKWLKVLLSIISIVLILFASACLWAVSVVGSNSSGDIFKDLRTAFSTVIKGFAIGAIEDIVIPNLNHNEITKDPTELGIGATAPEQSDEIINIAFYGVDARDDSFTGRSDSIIILTVDKQNNKIKMSSVLRDSRLYLGEDYNLTYNGWDKITHAYNYGPELAITALNVNFNLNITDYVTVNFYYLEQIIDSLGGVDIYLTDDEIAYINEKTYGVDPITASEGMVHLNGAQAVNYSRDRTNGNDQARADRQQNVLEALFDIALNLSPLDYPSVIQNILPLCETSLDSDTILELAEIALDGFTIEKHQIPDIYEADSGFYENGSWMWSYDIEKETEILHDFIYENEGE